MPLDIFASPTLHTHIFAANQHERNEHKAMLANISQLGSRTFDGDFIDSGALDSVFQTAQVLSNPHENEQEIGPFVPAQFGSYDKNAVQKKSICSVSSTTFASTNNGIRDVSLNATFSVHIASELVVTASDCIAKRMRREPANTYHYTTAGKSIEQTTLASSTYLTSALALPTSREWKGTTEPSLLHRSSVYS